MSRRVVDLRMGSLTTYRRGVDSYDASKLGLGTLMVQKNDSGNTNKWAGPAPIGRLRVFEAAGSLGFSFPWAMQWNVTAGDDWLFLADVNTAAVTRRIIFAKYNRYTQVFSYEGLITLTLPPNSGNATVRAFRMTYDKHTVGTVAVSGGTVTGTSTLFQTDRVPVGCRIGFGSIDPTAIVNWYEITGISADGSLTIDNSTISHSAGTAYVIEDLRAIVVTTNVTTANGGLFVAKGLRPEIFTPIGTTIGAAVSTDNVRACYHLRDANPNTVITAAGLALEDKTNNQSHTAWVLHGTTTMQLFKFNLRAALTPSSGEAQDAFVLKTAVSGTLTGTGSQNNNGRIATAAHGPGSGVKSIYFTTTTRIYRTKLTDDIISNDSSFLADNMTEIPPGGTVSFAASSLMNSIEYSSLIDRFIVMLNATGDQRPYLTKYLTDGSELERNLWADLRQTDQSTASSQLTPAPSQQVQAMSSWIEGGMLYLAHTASATAIAGILWAIPIGADWQYEATALQRLVMPKMSLPNCDQLVRVNTRMASFLGGDLLGLPTEPARLYYRASGIDDDSGAWTAIDASGDFTAGLSPAEVQIAVEFRVGGPICIPGRIFSVGVIYDDTTTDTHYQPSVNQSNVTNKRFAWRHAVAFGGTVPALRVRLYDADTAGLLLDDNTDDEASGTFERSTDNGANWAAWTSADVSNDTTYIRYTPVSFADNIRVVALLTQL